MSSPKVRNKSVEKIANPEKETEKCGIGRISRLPTPARSPSVPGQKNKNLTSGIDIGRPSVTMQSQMHENSRLLGTVASDETNIDKASPITSGRRTTSKSVTSTSHPQVPLNATKLKSSITSGGNSAMVKRQMETQFAIKRKRYATLKKELTDRQKSASDLYEEMSQLRDKLIASGAKDPGKIESINLAGFPTQQHRTSRFTSDSNAFRGSGEQVFFPNPAVTREFVLSLETKLRTVPDRRFDFCGELLKKRSEIVERFAEFSQKKDETNIECETSNQLEIYHKENSELATRLEQYKKTEDEMTNEIVRMISVVWNEVEISRTRIRELENTSQEIMKELRVKVDAAADESKIEIGKLESLQERKQALEMELQKLKLKIRTMETRTSDDETKIANLRSTVTNLETQLKQKECGSEQRLKDMQKSLKNSESLLAKTERQRDNFESRMNELKKDLASKESDSEAKIKELSKKLEKNIENQKRHTGPLACDESQLGSQLAERDNKIATLQRENEDLIRVIHQELLAEGIEFKIDGHSNTHDTIVSALKMKMEAFRTNVKLTRDKNRNLQTELLNLHSRMEEQSNESGKGKSVWSIQVSDLRQEISDLRCNVAELTRRNEELEIQLNQKQLQFEEQERAMREQRRILKVRDEVIGLLKEKPDARTSCEGGHLPVAKKKNSRDREQVDKQIAEKTENLQQLYSTLEAKQMQITRLEQLVQKMEIQQDRAQEQRTRLEKKIGQLQLAIHYKSRNHRYVMPTVNPVSSTKSSSAPNRESSPNPRVLQKSVIPTNSQTKVSQPRSYSRPPGPRPPFSHPQIQRSKTLNSIQLKPRSTSNNDYAYRVIDEVVRTLKRERAYDCRKMVAIPDPQYSGEDPGAGYGRDDSCISKDDIHEYFYNWLVQPSMLEGEPSNLTHPSNPVCQSRWPRGYTTNSEISVIANHENPTPRLRVGLNDNDCSRESRCGSPGCRRQSIPDWNYSASPPRVRTTPQQNNASHSRRKRSLISQQK